MSRSGSSKYQQISKEIIQKIENGVFLPGDKIPSENELITNFNISNTTARKVLLELEHQGWCTRIKGKGTFVLNRFKDKHLTRILGSFDAMKESFSNNLRKEGFIANNIILEKVILENGISTLLNDRNYIMEGPVVKIRRLRYGNEILLKDETKYISMACCPKINLLSMEESLIKIYEEKYHLVLEEVQRMIGTVVLLLGDPANYFENEDPLAVFTLDGAVFQKNGKIVEIEKSLYRGDKYKFAINTKPQLFQGG